MFVLLTSISQYISKIILFSEYEILTGWLVNTKLLGFCLLWDMTVYVIACQNCPTGGHHDRKLSNIGIYPQFKVTKVIGLKWKYQKGYDETFSD
jgi:hypothetical protein